MDGIPADEMVIEYMGDVIRPVRNPRCVCCASCVCVCMCYLRFLGKSSLCTARKLHGVNVSHTHPFFLQSVADLREKQYDKWQFSDCYMFRIDEETIVDATVLFLLFPLFFCLQ